MRILTPATAAENKGGGGGRGSTPSGCVLLAYTAPSTCTSSPTHPLTSLFTHPSSLAETYPHRGETYKERHIETYSDGTARDPYRLKGTFVTGMERRLGNNMWRNFRGEGRGKTPLSLLPSLHTFSASTVPRDAALEVEERDNECGESPGLGFRV